jgi:hypothetical protein
MKPDRRTLISTGVVGAVLIGGVSVTATAFAGRLAEGSKVSQGGSGHGSSHVSPTDSTPPRPEESVGPIPAPSEDSSVVSSEIGRDPGDVTGSWPKDRMQNAEPVPIPQVSISIIQPND